MTTPEEVEKLIFKGWQFVAVLPNDKVVLRQGSTQNVDGPDRIRTGDLTLRKRSHYPSYATSPKRVRDLRLIWITISQWFGQRCREYHQIHERSRQLVKR